MATKNAPDPAAGLTGSGRTRTLAAIKRIKQELADLEKIVRSSSQVEIHPEPKRRAGSQVEIHPEPKRHPGRKAQAARS